MNKITLLGLSIIFCYCIIQILQFYGINQDVYGIYLNFYILIILSIFILPNDYPKF
jgi:hypothetical protein